MEHWTLDNTDGYSQAELDALNRELETLLVGIEPHTDAWNETKQRFTDTVAGR